MTTGSPSSAPGSETAALPSPTPAPADEPGLAIAYVRDGNIHLWNESTGQTRTIVDTGDAIAVTMSDELRFEPDAFSVAAGETVRFEVTKLAGVDESVDCDDIHAEALCGLFGADPLHRNPSP